METSIDRVSHFEIVGPGEHQATAAGVYLAMFAGIANPWGLSYARVCATDGAFAMTPQTAPDQQS